MRNRVRVLGVMVIGEAASRVRFGAVVALTVSLVFGGLSVLALAGFLHAPSVYLETREAVGLALVHVSAYVGITMFVVGLLEVEYRLFRVHPLGTVSWFAVASNNGR